MSKGSDVSDCYLLLQKTFASESCVSCHQRFVNCPPNCLQNCPFDFLVENWHLSKGSDVSDCSLSSQKTFASESCVTFLQRFVETETAACPFLAQLPHQTFVQMGRIVAWVFVDSVAIHLCYCLSHQLFAFCYPSA